MARSLVVSQYYACLVGLVVFLAASKAPFPGHGLACSSRGQLLLEACSEHADHHTAAISVQFPAKNVSSDDVLIFQTSDFWLCRLSTFRPPSTEQEPPVRVVIASPTQNGTYPVILFKHGFAMLNCFYTQLFHLLASSGYIIVAPRYLDIFSQDCSQEIEQTAEVANWIPKSLQSVLKVAMPDANVVPDMSNFIMAGHSRGGKIAFAMVLGKASIEVPSFSALVALDPVDSAGVDFLSEPRLVEPGCNHTRNQITFPVLVLGTGYGSEPIIPFMPISCAPTCCSHAAFFNCSSAPIMYRLVASDYGHLNFLDVVDQYLMLAMCKSGPHNESLNTFTRELIVAFLESALHNNQTSMDNILDNWESANIKLQEPQVYRADDALYFM